MAAIVGKKRSASPPEGGGPPAKEVALGPPAEPPQRNWDFTKIEDIPQSIRAKKVAKFSVEVVYKGENPTNNEHPTNHTITRLTFQHKQEHDTAYMVAGTAGLTIDLQVDLTDLAGHLRNAADVQVKTFTYDGVHKRAVYAYDVPIKPTRKGRGGRNSGKTVKDFLEVLLTNNFVPCGFNIEDYHIVGCKDFTSQYVYRLNEAKILDIPAATAQDFYDRFNYNHTLPYHDERKEGEDYVRFKVNVGRAVWNPISDEKHVDIPGIVYVGRPKRYGGKDVQSDDQSSKVSTSETSAGSSGSL
ncbi:hypothetical protein N7494_012928 [Penicillium frequentans]|uniref:Uncharacterized protein n=1 Tax=Penicillium frequentans TaxID=3151616 RepID=A0AAD6GB25_9EURO|nr:hypothetical protein N7494_012928 [Penicillium glabrum]